MNILLIKAYGLTPHNITVTQPLGLMYLASFLREKCPDKYNIKLVDTRLSNISCKRISEITMEVKPDVVGISALTMEAKSMHAIASAVKASSPGCKIVVGGPHPTSFLEKTLADSNIDCVVVGEGEATFQELVETFENNGDIDKVKGLAFVKDGNVYKTENREYIKNIDTIPFPAWDLIDFDAYKEFFGESPLGKRNDMVMFTSRACPFQCIYCHKIFGKGFRARSVENVMKEIDILYNKYGIRDIDIVDDCFNLDAERTEKICDMIIEGNYKIKISFPNGLRSDRLELKTIKKLYDAGTRYISFAVESITPRIQTLIRKNLKVERLKNVIDYASGLGIVSGGFFMIGFPTETKKEILDTINYAFKSNLHLAFFLIVTPFKGTELFDMCKKTGKNNDIDFEDYSFFNSSFNLSAISDSELRCLQKWASRKFYLNPLRILRILKVYVFAGNAKNLFSLFLITLSRLFMKIPEKDAVKQPPPR